MHIASQTFVLKSIPQMRGYLQKINRFILPGPTLGSLPLLNQLRHNAGELCNWKNIGYYPAVAVQSDAQVSSHFEGFSVSTAWTEDFRELKISIDVSGTRTQMIFNDVFEKMVAAAQPIPGFRRVKGGKTPDIPKDILLEVLGPSKVFKEVIKKLINSTVAEYVEKGGLKVSNDLRVEQSFEDLEAAFVEGQKFSFDAVIQLKKQH